MSSVVVDLLEKISNLTLLQASELASGLKEKLNLPDLPSAPAVSAGSVDANAASAGGDSKKDSSGKFTLVLTSSGEKKISAVKALKTIFKKAGQELGLQEIKKKVDELPCKVFESLSKEDADAYAKDLAESGCKYELKEE